MPAGLIQNEDIKSAAELVSAGGTAAQLPNDTKVYLTANSLNKTLNQAILDGDLASGGGTVNFVTNPKAQANASSAGVYADSGSRPTDGTGGSPTVTIARNTTNGLDTTDFLLTKPASNVQGQGYSWDVVIPRYARGKVCQISINYEIASGTYSGGTSSTDSDLIAYIYSVTDSKLNEPAPIKLDGAIVGTQYRYVGTFQTSTTDASLRLLLHHATTSASAFTMKAIVQVSPQVVSVGGSIGDWADFTPTGTFSSNATYTGRWRRVGANAEIQWRCSFSGGTSGSNAVLNLPSGLVMDSTKMNNATIGNTALGIGALFDASAGYGFNLTGDWSSSTAIILRQQDASGPTVLSSNGISATSPVTIATGDAVIFNASVPIVGWGASQVLSSETDTRVVACTVDTPSAQAVSATTDTVILFTPTTFDTHGSYDAATGKYTFAVAGYYEVSTRINYGNTTGTNTIYRTSVFKNGSNFKTIGRYVKPTGTFGADAVCAPLTIKVAAGDYIQISVNNDEAATTNSTGFLSVKRVSGPSQIVSTESIAARYVGCATSLTSSDAAFTYATKDYDTHGMVSGSTVTIPIAGKYRISAKQQYLGTFASSNSSNISIFKTGSKVSESVFTWPASGSAMTMAIVDEINCLAGDTIQIQGSSAGTGLSVNNSTTRAVFTISRIGN